MIIDSPEYDRAVREIILLCRRNAWTFDEKRGDEAILALADMLEEAAGHKTDG